MFSLKKESPVNTLRDYLIGKNVNIIHISEYNTSKRCFICGGLTYKKRFVMYKDGSVYPSHWVLSCTECQKHMVEITMEKKIYCIYYIIIYI